MAFDPDAFLGSAPVAGFDPDAFLGAAPAAAGVESRIVELGGVKQPDGTYLVPGSGGTPAFRLDASGNRLDAAPAIGEESTKEAILGTALATAGSAVLPVIPQAKGLEAGLQTLGTSEGFGEAYRKAREGAKTDVEAAKKKAGIGAEIAGAVISGGIAAPASTLGRIGLAAGLSAAEQALSSDVDLTKEGADLGQYGKEVLGAGALGAVAGGVGETLGYGLRKLGAKGAELASKAFARQEAADLKAVEKGIKSLAGELGAETQKGSRFIENVQRGTAGITDPAQLALAQGVLSRNLASIPGQLATIDAKSIELAAKTATRLTDSAEATKKYFAQSLFASEVLPRLKGQAPRWGMAAAGMALGEGYDLVTGSQGHGGRGAGALFGLGSTLSSPGMRAMLGNVMKSNRVQVAVGTKLSTLMAGAATAVTRGTVLTAAEIAALSMDEGVLGPPSLAAEQLVARGGVRSILGDNGMADPEVTALNAPQSPLDKAIQQTVGVTVLAGALEEHGEKLDKAMARVFKGEHEAGAKEHALPDDLAHLAANPEAMLERLANNTGSLSSVAPMVAAELAATAQRATAYLAQVSTEPPRRGPLAPEWTPGAAEKRSLRLATGVIANPMSVLDAAAAGTIVPEQVAALNAVYPMLGRSIADKALSMLEAGKAVPYRARLMVGFLAGIDVDGTLASIASNQMAIQAQSQKPSNQSAPPADGADKLTVAQRSSPRKEKEAS